jgi:hypothetical protein
MICRMSRNKPLAALIHQLNPVLRGWCVHFRPGVSSRTFAYLRVTGQVVVACLLLGGHPGVALGESDEGVEEGVAVLGRGGQVAAYRAELLGSGKGA